MRDKSLQSSHKTMLSAIGMLGLHCIYRASLGIANNLPHCKTESLHKAIKIA